MPTAKKRGDSWRCQAYANGQRQSFTAPTKKEAEWLAAEWLYKNQSAKKAAAGTVDSAISAYIESRTNILSPATIAGYKKMQRLYFGSIKNIKVAKLTEIEVQHEINEMAKTLSPKTIRNAYGLLKSATKINFEITMPQKKKLIYNTPSVSEIRDIIDATAGTVIEVPVLLALWCGLRLSEIRGLRWNRVLPDRIIIDTVIVDVDGVPTIKQPKTTESTREIEIPQFLYDKIQSVPHTDEEFVFSLSGHAIYQRFRKLTGGICRFHDLRHANASIMMMLGVPDVYAMERGGWETESIYKKTYVQTMAEKRTEANKMIDDYFLKIVAPCITPFSEKSLLN